MIRNNKFFKWKKMIKDIKNDLFHRIWADKNNSNFDVFIILVSNFLKGI